MEITYKYCPEERSTYFSDQLLRFTQPSALNDPLECLPSLTVEEASSTAYRVVQHHMEEKLDLVKDRSREYRRRYKQELEKNLRDTMRQIRNSPHELRDFFFKQGIEKINLEIGILSLSRRWNSTLMWSHYTKSHEGFCIGFDRSNKFFFPLEAKLNSEKSPLHPVSYAEKRVRVPLEKTQKIDLAVMYTKSIDWKYEEEERMLGMFKNAKICRPAQPFPIYLFEVPHAAVKEVIIGVRASLQLEKEVLEFCSSKNITAYKAKMSDTNFDVERYLY